MAKSLHFLVQERNSAKLQKALFFLRFKIQGTWENFKNSSYRNIKLNE